METTHATTISQKLGSERAGQSESTGLPFVSVIMCCHNSASRLPQTLLHLSRQCVPHGLRWEIVVVDNASTDETVAVARRFAVESVMPAVRVVSEPRLGITHARLRGINETHGDIVLFVDDDNWLDAGYVALVAETFAQHPEVSALGGTSTAVYEQDPPAWMARHQRWYAISGKPDGRPALTEVAFLWGAGVAFRRTALTPIISRPMHLTGRRGQALHGGEDDELCCRLRACGERLFCHSGLQFQHFLPAHRVQWSYLRRLQHGAGETSVLLDRYRIAGPKADSRWPLWLVRNWHFQVLHVLGRLLMHPVVLWQSGRNAMEDDDRVLRVEQYKGRLAALWRHRRDYRQMVSSKQHE